MTTGLGKAFIPLLVSALIAPPALEYVMHYRPASRQLEQRIAVETADVQVASSTMENNLNEVSQRLAIWEARHTQEQARFADAEQGLDSITALVETETARNESMGSDLVAKYHSLNIALAEKESTTQNIQATYAAKHRLTLSLSGLADQLSQKRLELAELTKPVVIVIPPTKPLQWDISMAAAYLDDMPLAGMSFDTNTLKLSKRLYLGLNGRWLLGEEKYEAVRSAGLGISFELSDHVIMRPLVEYSWVQAGGGRLPPELGIGVKLGLIPLKDVMLGIEALRIGDRTYIGAGVGIGPRRT
ncbi:MAG: hypothetical protein V1743_02520 [Nanoarchaeota archaeon]